MKGYLSIGKVAKQKGVSIKSLRYYDRIGVFVPAYINKETNYRYYTEDQLFLLDAIQLCIELGIPLSRFEEYKDADGSLNIQKLLFDGKDLAEKKIRHMRSCIDQLQNTLSRLDAGKPATTHTPAPESSTGEKPERSGKTVTAAKQTDQSKEFTASDSKTVIDNPNSDTGVSTDADTSSHESDVSETIDPKNEESTDADSAIKLQSRYVITAEFDEVTTANRYNHMLLSLFVNAEKNGQSAGYPTGLIYETKNGVTTKSVFATLQGDITDPSALPASCRILPAGEYLADRSSQHRIEQASEVFPILANKKAGEDTLLIETDVMEEKGVKELQLLL
ncbi:MAG: MerR family transcriptional regulator [Lachnospiraceae bacterium]|nr:MerR family transcriptional regulator [Lachnospiraceae bacterium]